MKQSDLDSMSIDELLMLHQLITATLDAKITAEKEALLDRLKQADMGPTNGKCQRQTVSVNNALLSRETFNFLSRETFNFHR